VTRPAWRAVIPAPLRVTPGAGAFRFGPGTTVGYRDPALGPVVERACRDLARRTGIRVEPAPAACDDPAADEPAVRLELGGHPDLDPLPAASGISPVGGAVPDERHALTIEADRITLRGGQVVGVARGLTTLVQMLATAAPGTDGAAVLPGCRILDAPRFAWRGLTLDVARAWFSVAELKRVIDLLALYKVNVLHLHLTDDQAWRIEAGRPADRREPDGTFYTDAELRDLVAHADERFVTLVPEADAPGHTAALLLLHPELDSGRNVRQVAVAPGSPIPWRSVWLDPDLPATFQVMDQVLAEIAGIFPGRYLHLGADEPFGMPEHLYARYLRRAREHARSLGRHTVAFQESVRAITEPDHVIQYWIGDTDPEPLPGLDQDAGQDTGQDAGQDAGQDTGQDAAGAVPDDLEAASARNTAQSRRDVETALRWSVPVLVTPRRHAYCDVPYAEPSADPAQEPLRQRLGLRHYPPQTVAETFDWEPAAALGGDAGTGHVVGVGAAMWCETVDGFDDLTFLLMPRLAGNAEKGWGAAGSTTWSGHRAALAVHGRLWAQDGVTCFRSSGVDWAPDRAPA